MKQIIGILRTVIERQVVFEVEDDIEVETTSEGGSMIRIPQSGSWVSPAIAVQRGFARVVFDGGKEAQ